MTEPHERSGNKFDFKLLTVVIALLSQVAGGFWMAARFTAKMDVMVESVEKIEREQISFRSEIRNNNLNEYRLLQVEARVKELEARLGRR